jgi:hypothetical protein
MQVHLDHLGRGPRPVILNGDFQAAVPVSRPRLRGAPRDAGPGNRGAGRRQRLEQFLLAAGQLEARGVAALGGDARAEEPGPVTEHGDADLRARRRPGRRSGQRLSCSDVSGRSSYQTLPSARKRAYDESSAQPGPAPGERAFVDLPRVVHLVQWEP